MPNERSPFFPTAETWLWDVLDPQTDAPVAWLPERFSMLAAALKGGRFTRTAAIVPAAGPMSKLASLEIDGGRDAKFVVVYTRELPADWLPGFQETLTYRRDVAGTDLIYDLTGEFMQGKARPFLADFRELPLRVYAVLPFQVEHIDLAAEQHVMNPTVPKSCFGFEMAARLRFLDGQREPILARLPYHIEMRHTESGNAGGMYLYTRPDEGFPKGFCAPVKNLDGRWTLTIRTLLTGDEAVLPFAVSHDPGRRVKDDISLTSDGLTIRRAPQPVKRDKV